MTLSNQPGLVTVEDFFRDHAGELGLRLLAGATGLRRIIREPTVNRPGLALAGFRKYFAPKRVQVIGNVETAYLKSLSPATRLQRYRELFSWKFPCLVLCRGLRADRAFMRVAEDAEIPVFQTNLVTMKFINQATLALEGIFAPRTQIHACMVDIQGIGVIIQGESGIGKSEAVLGLLERGYSLVADDVTRLRLVDGIYVMGSGKELGRNLMEVRGIGIVDVAAMFGVAAIRSEKQVDVIIVMKAWEKCAEIDRLGLEDQTHSLLGIPIPIMELPVRPGRDMARLIEVAAYQTKLKLSGIHPGRELMHRMTAAMRPKI
jgi:HPr kinase/phosphorylase